MTNNPTAHTTAASSMSETKKIDNDSSSEEDLKKDGDAIPSDLKASGAMDWEGNHDDFPMRTFAIKNAEGKPVFLLNPVVSFIGMAILW
ncbi:MAG: hypothetical protein SGILL_009714, partial [Bacillariaceae sp.]